MLAVLSLLLSGLLNRVGCHLLLRCAVLTRKRSFEDMALQVLGPAGKLVVELCVLGFLLGTCVAYFVVIGDLGPSILSDVTGWPDSPHLRAFTITAVAMFVALPLALLRRADSLSSFSALSFLVYALLAVRLFSDSSVTLMSDDSQIRNRFVWWDGSDLLQYIPIFAMSLSCQTQLFELFDHSLLNFDANDVVPKLNRIVRRAVHMCSVVYVSIGLFGYVAFHDSPFGGNILSFLPASISSTLMKMGFVATIAVSLPLCLFPCRTSLYSLLMKSNRRDVSRSSLMNEFVTSSGGSHYMTDRHFRLLTVLLIVFTVSISIIVPKIEFVLSIVGSTTGTVICFVLPGLMYSQLTRKNTTERLLALFLTYFGLFVLIICTFASLNSFTQSAGFDVTIPNLPLNSKASVPAVAVIFPDIEKGSDSRAAAGPAVDSMVLKQKQEELLRKLEKNQEEQKILIEEQKKVLREFKKHEQVLSEIDKTIDKTPNSNQSAFHVPESERKNDQLVPAIDAARSASAGLTSDTSDSRISGRMASVKLRNKNLTIINKAVDESPIKSEKSAPVLHNESAKVTASPKNGMKDASAVKDF